MFFYRSLWLTVMGLFWVLGSHAQTITSDPTTWQYELEQTDTGNYLVFVVNLQDGWHIWALDPGGDGFQIPPSFSVEDDQVKLVGPVAEYGHRETVEMDGIDGAVHYYGGQVQYRQQVQLSPAANQVTGRHIYQVCNDRMCLPPIEKEFVIEVKSGK